MDSTLPDTWESVVEAKPNHVFLDKFDEGVRFLVVRGPFHLCAYLGIPASHPLANRSYDDLPLRCHGGLTFASAGKPDSPWAEGLFWYGWDYGHSGDYATYYDTPALASRRDSEDTKWTPKMVESDAWSAIYEFKQLMRLVER